MIIINDKTFKIFYKILLEYTKFFKIFWILLMESVELKKKNAYPTNSYDYAKFLKVFRI